MIKWIKKLITDLDKKVVVSKEVLISSTDDFAKVLADLSRDCNKPIRLKHRPIIKHKQNVRFDIYDSSKTFLECKVTILN